MCLWLMNTNSILADDFSRAIPGNLKIQEAPPGNPIWIKCLTDVSLVDEDTNLILADYINRAIPGNLKIQVARPGNPIWIKCKMRHLED